MRLQLSPGAISVRPGVSRTPTLARPAHTGCVAFGHGIASRVAMFPPSHAPSSMPGPAKGARELLGPAGCAPTADGPPSKAGGLSDLNPFDPVTALRPQNSGAVKSARPTSRAIADPAHGRGFVRAAPRDYWMQGACGARARARGCRKAIPRFGYMLGPLKAYRPALLLLAVFAAAPATASFAIQLQSLELVCRAGVFATTRRC